MGLFFLDDVTHFTGSVMGADWVYFSQPRFVDQAFGEPPYVATLFFGHTGLTGVPGFPPPRGVACLARCSYVIHIGPSQDETIPLLCGGVAGVDPKGRHLCTWHAYVRWHCHHCGDWLLEGEGGFCSPACKEERRKLHEEYGEE